LAQASRLEQRAQTKLITGGGDSGVLLLKKIHYKI